jgi:methylated-DNA-protein-cysteine methyltransferase-like protein
MRKNRGNEPFASNQLAFQKTRRSILYAAMRADERRDLAFRRIILSIPPGKVSTYGRVAAAAGYPRLHRAVARLLRNDRNLLPWHRVLGVGGEIKLRGAPAQEQRKLLRLEGVRFSGERVDMDRSMLLGLGSSKSVRVASPENRHTSCDKLSTRKAEMGISLSDVFVQPVVAGSRV